MNLDEVNHTSYSIRILHAEAASLPIFTLPGPDNPLDYSGRFPILGGSIYDAKVSTYIAVPYFYLFGVSQSSQRIFELSLGGAIIILCSLFLLRRGLRFEALVCAIILATDPWLIFSLRSQAHLTLFSSAFVLGGIILYGDLAERRKRPLRTIAAGVLIGVGAMSYFCGYLLAAAFICALLSIKEYRQWSNITYLVVGCFAGVLPQLVALLTLWVNIPNLELSQVIPQHARTHGGTETGKLAQLLNTAKLVVASLDLHPYMLRITGNTQPLTSGLRSSLFLVGCLSAAVLSFKPSGRIEGRLISAICVVYCVILTAFAAGLREWHILPILPFAALGVSFVLGSLWRNQSRAVRLIVPVVGISLGLLNLLEHRRTISGLRVSGGAEGYSEVYNNLASYLDSTAHGYTVYFLDWGLHLQTLFLTEGRVKYHYTPVGTKEGIADILLRQSNTILVARGAQTCAIAEQAFNIADLKPTETRAFYSRAGVPMAKTYRFIAEPYDLNDTLRFEHGSPDTRLLGFGWSTPEVNGTWSISGASNLIIPYSSISSDTLEMRLAVYPLLTKKTSTQVLRVFINGAVIGTWPLSEQRPYHITQPIPAEIVRTSSSVLVTLEVQPTLNEVREGESADQRNLGILLQSLTLMTSN